MWATWWALNQPGKCQGEAWMGLGPFKLYRFIV